MFRAETIRGLIFSASRSPSAWYAELQRAGLAMVAVSRLQKGLQIDHVMVANRDGAYTATVHLIQHGHQRIGFINGPLVFTTARDRQSGYDDALREANLPMDGNLVVHCDFRQEAGRAALNQLLDLPDAPKAVFTASNLLTLGALQAIHERDLDIPGQIAIVGFDEMPWAMSLRPPLTTVEQPAFEVGRTAAQLLIERINKPSLPPRRVVLGTRLIVRSSCGAEGGDRESVSAHSSKTAVQNRRSMTHRERILSALAHRAPDRVPIDLGATFSTSINVRAYAALRAWLGLPPEPSPAFLLARAGTIIPGEDIVSHFDLDARPMVMGAPDQTPGSTFPKKHTSTNGA